MRRRVRFISSAAPPAAGSGCGVGGVAVGAVPLMIVVLPDTTLLDASIAASTRKRYDTAFAEFTAWANGGGHSLLTPTGVDAALAMWMLKKYRDGYYPSTGRAAMSAVLHRLPSCKWQLSLSSRSLRGWDRLKPPGPRPPLIWPLACAVACRAGEYGHTLIGIGVLLSFSGLLRIGEVLRIRVCDVADYGDKRMAGAPDLWITLSHTKTGPNHAVSIDDSWAQRIVRFAVAFRKLNGTGKGALDFLLGVTEQQYRAVFRRACDSLGVPTAVVPHSLRHGGATHRLIVLKQPQDAVRRHGRWVSPKSLDHYTNAPAASMMAAHAPADSVAWGEKLAKDPVWAVRCATLVAAKTGGSHHLIVTKLLV